jgi:hypothetical protein
LFRDSVELSFLRVPAAVKLCKLSTLRREEQNYWAGPTHPHETENIHAAFSSEASQLDFWKTMFENLLLQCRVPEWEIASRDVVPLETVVVLCSCFPYLSCRNRFVMVSREHSTVPPPPTTDPSLFSSYIQLSKVLKYVHLHNFYPMQCRTLLVRRNIDCSNMTY